MNRHDPTSLHLLGLDKDTVLDVSSLAIEVGQGLSGVHRRIEVGLSLPDGLNPPEVGGTPHLVSVELVGTLELVAADRLRALEQCVARLEAQLFVPAVLLHVVVSHEG